MTRAWRDPRIVAGMRRQLQLRRRRLEEGAASLGWKLGFGTVAARERLGTDAPLVGFLVDRARLRSGASVSIEGWTRPVIEPEVAVYLGHDVTAPADREAVRKAISAIGPAIELADLSFAPDDVEAILAADIYQRHVVLGRSDDTRAGGRLEGLSAEVRRDGSLLATVDDLEAPTGELLGNVLHVASLLASLGETLRAGEVVITGSLVPPIEVDRPTEVRYALRPVDTISLDLVG